MRGEVMSEKQGIPLVGVTPGDDFQFLRMTEDGWAMLHPDLVAQLERIEKKLDELLASPRISGLKLRQDPATGVKTMDMEWVEE
jgi:hypothetical protein